MEDQLAAVERTSKERGNDYTDLALVTDGLRAEREQGITIDVAYRYFATSKRKFIIADTPGHIQYTRNMVTGTSTAQLAIVLVDARHGLLEQSRRHAFLASLLGIRHIVLAVNKMDLVDWDQERFEKIRDDFHEFAARLDVHDVTTIPLSALNGDNVVTKSDVTPWYDGPGTADAPRRRVHRRRPQPGRRAIPGAVRDPAADPRARRSPQLCGHRRQRRHASRRRGRRAAHRKDQPDHRDRGPERAGRRSLPADGGVGQPGRRHRHLARRHDRPARTTSRGSHRTSTPRCAGWPTKPSLEPGRDYLIKHTTRTTRAKVTALDYRLDVNTLHRDKTATALKLNELGRISLRTQVPLLLDEYSRNAATGSFILIDPNTNGTVAAGMILPHVTARTSSPNTVRHESLCKAEDRLSKGRTVWFTGLSGSGKSSVAMLVEQKLLEKGVPAYVLDGDNLRHGLNADLGFSMADRAENQRRLAHVAAILADSGQVVLVPAISPLEEHRALARQVTTDAGPRLLRGVLRHPAGGLRDDATRRGCTPRRAPARSPTSPGSTAPTSGRRTPICGSRRSARRMNSPTG